MKNIKLLLLGALTVFFVGCSDFGDMNINPNETTKVAPEVLLTSALKNVSDAVGATSGILYSQHMSETQYTEESRYQDVNYNFNDWYTGPLADLQHIIDLNTDDATKADALGSGSNANQIAVARIMKAYFFQFLTDRWGAVPYTNALKGKDNFKPTYDSQESIYAALFTELTEAADQIDGGAAVAGDFIFGGDMDTWKKFANTLRMNMAMRIADVDATTAKAQFTSAMNGGHLSSDAMYPYLSEAANQNPWFERFITRTDYAVSSTMVDYLTNLNDPRLAAYADEAPNFPGEVKGMPYGIANAGDIPNADISFPNSNTVRAQDAPVAIFTMAQVHFLLAEAAHRGWINNNAKDEYEAGIQASWTQWGVSGDFSAYNAQADVAWDAARAYELIGGQKWAALYLQGYEAWSEYRRLKHPALVAAPDPLNTSGNIPSRQAYPTSERDLNGVNWQASIDAYYNGVDDLDGKMWWDVN